MIDDILGSTASPTWFKSQACRLSALWFWVTHFLSLSDSICKMGGRKQVSHKFAVRIEIIVEGMIIRKHIYRA